MSFCVVESDAIGGKYPCFIFLRRTFGEVFCEVFSDILARISGFFRALLQPTKPSVQQSLIESYVVLNLEPLKIIPCICSRPFPKPLWRKNISGDSRTFSKTVHEATQRSVTILRCCTFVFGVKCERCENRPKSLFSGLIYLNQKPAYPASSKVSPTIGAFSARNDKHKVWREKAF